MEEKVLIKISTEDCTYWGQEAEVPVLEVTDAILPHRNFQDLYDLIGYTIEDIEGRPDGDFLLTVEKKESEK